MKTHIFLLFCFCSMAYSLDGQVQPKNFIRKFTTAQGLSSNYVYHVIQDQYGFIWVGTEEGLTKFDGKTFTGFTTRKGRYQTTHNRTQALLLMPDGNVWAGTSSGLNIYDYLSDSIIQITQTTSPLSLNYDDITCMTLSQNKKKTWIGTYGDGVHFYDNELNTFKHLELKLPPGVSAPLNVMSILEDDNGRLWIGTQYNGIYKYDITADRLEHLFAPEKELFIRSIFQDSFKRIWIGTSIGLFIYNETVGKLDAVNYPALLNANAVGAIHEDQTGKLWVGGEGFLINFPVRSFSKNEKFSYQFYEHGESDFKLRSLSVNSIFADRDNNIWIGTAWGGMNMLRGIPPKFQLIKHEPGDASTLPAVPVLSLCKKNEEEVYIGTNGAGIFKMNTATGKISRAFALSSLNNSIVQSILFDQSGNCWIGTYNSGLLKANKHGQIVKQFATENSLNFQLPHNDVRCLLEDKSGRIWIGTNNGLAMYNPSTGAIDKIMSFRSRLGLRSIQEGDDGWLWLGTYGEGIISYHYTKDSVNFNPIPVNSLIVNDIQIRNENIWLATHGDGLIYYNTRLNTGKTINDDNGLSSNYIHSVLIDSNGTIWLGTSNGISEYNPSTEEIRNYNNQDGVQPYEFTGRCALPLLNGELLIGGHGGLNRFDPIQVKKDDHTPPVVFSRLSVFNQLIRPGSGSAFSPLNENITLAKDIVLKHHQSVFAIDFIGINYNANEKIQYAYFLEGSDKDWNYIGTQSSITFRDLSPGNYRLKVKASSPDAVWTDDKIAGINIRIHPPYWKSWWAYLLYGFCALVVVYLIWQYSTVRIRSSNILKIERAKREKDEELHQDKMQFFTNISHEFRTPLTLLMGPLEDMKSSINDVHLQTQLNTMIKNTKRMLFMVNQLLDFRKTEKGQLFLRVTRADIVAFINDIMLSYNDVKNKKNIRFEFRHEEEQMMTWFDGEFVEKALYNLLSNSFKYTPDGGTILIKARFIYMPLKQKKVVIEVVDNGHGIDPNDLPHIFERFYQGKNKSSQYSSGSGIGLHLARNLVELHHGTIQVESEPGGGTTFTITLPAQESDYSYIEISDENAKEHSYEMVDVETNEAIYTVHNEVKKQGINRILIVEDNNEIRNYIIEILGDKYEFEEAENGLQALKMTGENSYDLIITDLMMPEMDGVEFCKTLKSNIETDHIPIIMLTAKSSMENRIEGLDVGADSYITKPFYPDHLRVRVNRLIEQRSLFRQRFSQNIIIERKQVSDLNVSMHSPDKIFLQKVINIILEKMLNPDFNGDQLAREIGISRMGLHRKIKALTDQSTGEFIRKTRLSRACELLAVPGKNISEVCYEVGFNSPSYFTTCFTELYNQTPTNFVKSIHDQQKS